MAIATVLGESKAVDDFKEVCRKHDHDEIRRVLVEVDKVPQNKIKKSKRALFFYLLNTNAKQTS